MSRSTLALAILVVIQICFAARAQTHQWINPAGGSFFDSANWDTMMVPGSGQSVHFGVASGYTVTLGQALPFLSVFVDRGDIIFDFAGLGIGNSFANLWVGTNPGENTVVRLQNGRVNSPGALGHIDIGVGSGVAGEMYIVGPMRIGVVNGITVGNGGVGRLELTNGANPYYPGAGYLNLSVGGGGTVVMRGAGTMSNPGYLELSCNNGIIIVEEGATPSINQGGCNNGFIHVRGTGSMLRDGGVGMGGSGRLDVTDGGFVANAGFTGDMEINVLRGGVVNCAGAAGGTHIVVDGAGSHYSGVWQGYVEFGVRAGATAELGSAEGSQVAAEGMGTVLRLGGLIGGGFGASLHIRSGSALDSLNHPTIYIVGSAIGGITDTFATIEFGSRMDCNTLRMGEGAHLLLEGGSVFRSSSALVGGQVSAFESSGEGRITVSSGSNAEATFVELIERGALDGDGALVGNVSSGGVVEPGIGLGTLTIDGDYSQSTDGKLLIELTTNSSDHLTVTGSASLSGKLVLDGALGPPPLGQSFEVLSAASVIGTFDSASVVGMTPRTGAGVEYGSTSVSVALHAPCFGDADGDRDRDFADISQVLALFGSSGSPTVVGDADGDGVVAFGDVTAVLGMFLQPCP